MEVIAEPFPRGVPVLADDVVMLRAHRAADAARIVEASRDEGMLRWTTVPRPYREEDARAFLAFIASSWNDAAAGSLVTPLHWVLCRVASPETYLGTIDLRPTGHGSAEIAFGLHPDARGAGLTSRVTRLLQAYAVQRHVTTVRWRACAGNWPSRRVAWSCGFTHEGTERAALPQPSLDGSATRDADAWGASWRAGEPTVPRHPWFVPPVLRVQTSGGVGVRLRPWREDDGRHLPAEPDAESWHRLGRAAPTSTSFADDLDGWRDEMALGTRVSWCLADPDTDRPLGGIWLFGVDAQRRPGTAEVGVFLVPAARGRGLFRTSLEPVLGHAFAPAQAGGLGFVRVRSLADVDNHASVRSLLAGGMTLTGWTRHDRPERRPGHEGGFVDMLQFEVLATDDRAAIARAHADLGYAPAPLLASAADRLRSRLAAAGESLSTEVTTG